MNKPFKPYEFAPLAVTLDGSTKLVVLPQIARSDDTVRIVVAGTATARVKRGNSTAVTGSVANGSIMLANSVEVFTLDTGNTHFAISGAAGSTVEIEMGTGA